MSRFFVILISFFIVCVTQAQTIATIQKGSFKQNVPLHEVKEAYQFVLEGTLNAPSPKKFVEDYVRYRIALIEAYNDKTLLKSSKVRSLIASDSLKKSIDQTIYRAFVDKKMRKPLISVDNQTQALTDADLKKTYSSEPAFNFHFIVVDIPSNANKKQISNIQKRARSIYSKVIKDKRPFEKLVPLYSDNGAIGTSNISYTKISLYPLIYDALKKMRPNQVSKPVRTPNAFYIMKLKKIVPFSQINKEAIRGQVFTSRRNEVFKQYFNKLQSKYKVNINDQVVKSL